MAGSDGEALELSLTAMASARSRFVYQLLNCCLLISNYGLTGTRTGKYEIFLDNLPPTKDGEQQGIYNEDMAVAIVDEVENNNLNHKHWTCAGPLNLGKW